MTNLALDREHIRQEELECDVLILGGGIGGLSAAVALKEANPDADVLVMEKQTAGYAGKANKGGGVLQYFDLKQTPPEAFVEYHAHNVGCYLGNQKLMHKYVAMNNELIERLGSWGVKIPELRVPTGPMTYMIGVDLDITLQVQRTAKRLGVRFLNKTPMSDLLMSDDGRLAGAVGYSIIDGTFYVVRSKLVILATGSQNYRVASMWSSGRGDGIAAAYRAGARMRNPEFGNFAQLFRARSNREVVFGENVMYDNYGENITKNFRRFPEADISSTAVAEWYNQMARGRGPVQLHVWENPQTDSEEMMLHLWPRPYGLRFWELDFEKANPVDKAEKDKPMECVIGLVGEQSPVEVDENMRTTIDGMYAIGDVSYDGSCAPGAVPAPPGRNRGSGILNAVFAGIVAADDAAGRLGERELLPVSEKTVDTLREAAFAPLWREEGVHPKDVIRKIQDLVCPVENMVYMSQNRLDVCLRKLEEIKPLVSQLKADDLHYLISCHEAAAMVLSAEMQFKAASMRKESRGWFLREDYPQMDNEHYLHWTTVQNVDGEMTFGEQPVPIDDYPVKPPPKF